MAEIASWTVQHGRYTDIPVLDKPLGRMRMTDSRSAGYRYTVAGPRRVIKDTEWPRLLPILNQGNIGCGWSGTPRAARTPQERLGSCTLIPCPRTRWTAWRR